MTEIAKIAIAVAVLCCEGYPHLGGREGVAESEVHLVFVNCREAPPPNGTVSYLYDQETVNDT